MAYNEKLAERIEQLLANILDLQRKELFGGVGYLSRGHMFSGIYQGSLILRLGEKGAAEALQSRHTRPMDITGRPMKGWVLVTREGFTTDDELREWLEEALTFAAALPPRGEQPVPSTKTRRRGKD